MNSINTNQHPLDDVFDVEPNMTTRPALPPPEGAVLDVVDLVACDETPESSVYDERDQAIDAQLQTVHNQAMELANQLRGLIDWAPPAAQPRLGEVAIQSLGAALDAIRQKADIKKHKDKLVTPTAKSVHTTNNNLVVVSRSELLRRAHSS